MFNKYAFIDDLKESIVDAIENEEIKEHYDLIEFICEELERKTTYYGECFDIVKGCNFTNWSDLDYEIKCISSAAFAALKELIDEEIDYDYFNKLIQEKQENE